MNLGASSEKHLSVMAVTLKRYSENSQVLREKFFSVMAETLKSYFG